MHLPVRYAVLLLAEALERWNGSIGKICPREKLCSHWATALTISISGLAAAETIGFLATV